MSKQFNIRKGIYVVPNFGRIDATKKVKQDHMLALYLNPKFPFIELLPDGVALLKKAKLNQKQIAALILNAKTVQEIELLLEVNSSDTLKNIAETKKKALEK